MKRVKAFDLGQDIPNKAIFISTGERELSKGTLIPIFYYEVPDSVKRQDETRDLTAEIQEIIDYLNIKTGKKYSAKAKSNVQLIKPRLLSDQYTVEDFKKVIDNKCLAWLDDIKMSQYLRPETLFRASHFESYLNEKPAVEQEEDLFAELDSYKVSSDGN